MEQFDTANANLERYFEEVVLTLTQNANAMYSNNTQHDLHTEIQNEFPELKPSSTDEIIRDYYAGKLSHEQMLNEIEQESHSTLTDGFFETV